MCHVGAYYHRFNDCILPSYSWLEDLPERDTLLFSNRNFREILAVMVPTQKIEWLAKNEACFYVKPDATIISRQPEPDPYFLRANRSHSLRTKVWQQTKNSLFESRGILILQRAKTRRFTGASQVDLLSKSLSKFGVPVRFYYGNESFTRTVALFEGSDIVIGYHGAGSINTMFCRPWSLNIEITTFSDTNHARVWRTNERLVREGTVDVLWEKFFVPIPVTNLTLFSEVKDKDHFIKNQRTVPLTIGDILGIESLVKMTMDSGRYILRRGH